MKNFFYQIPKSLSGIFGIFKDSVVSLFLGAPEHKTESEHPKLVEQISFERRIHPLKKRVSCISFDSVGALENLWKFVP